MSSVAITFTYTNDPLVIAALGGFRVYAVDDDYARLTEAIEVPPDAIPTASAPLIVPMPAEATNVEVIPVDAHGYPGAATYLPVQAGLPPVLSVAQIVMVVAHSPAKRHDGR